MGSDTAPPLFEVQWRSLLAASKTMYIDRELFDGFVASARKKHAIVETGRFGADMKVTLTNDGPVTFWLQVKPKT